MHKLAGISTVICLFWVQFEQIDENLKMREAGDFSKIIKSMGDALRADNLSDAFGSVSELLILLQTSIATDATKIVDQSLEFYENTNAFEILRLLFCRAVLLQNDEIAPIVNIWISIIQAFYKADRHMLLIGALSLFDREGRNFVNYFAFSACTIISTFKNNPALPVTSLKQLFLEIVRAGSDSKSKNALIAALLQNDGDGCNAIYWLVRSEYAALNCCSELLIQENLSAIFAAVMNTCFAPLREEDKPWSNRFLLEFNFLAPSSLRSTFRDPLLLNQAKTVAYLFELVCNEMQELGQVKLDHMVNLLVKNWRSKNLYTALLKLIFNLLYFFLAKNKDKDITSIVDVTLFNKRLRDLIAEQLIFDAGYCSDGPSAFLKIYCPARVSGQATLFSVVIDTHFGRTRKGETNARQAIEETMYPTVSSWFFRKAKRRIVGSEETELVSLKI